MSERRRVVVTGLGMVTPAGVGVEANWSAVSAGRIAPLRTYDLDGEERSSPPVAAVTGFEPGEHIPNRKLLKLLTPEDAFALAAANQAAASAGLGTAGLAPLRCGIFTGSGKEFPAPGQVLSVILQCLDENGALDAARFGEIGMREIYPLAALQNLPNAALFYISTAYHLQGVNANLSGETSGVQSIEEAYQAIRCGEADLVMAVGFDRLTDPLSRRALVGFTAHNPSLCRPFDMERGGTLLGEGAAALVLEEAGHALQRGVQPLAEVTGCGSGTAASWPTNELDGNALAEAVIRAISENFSVPHQLDLIICHGDGTRQGDAAEAQGLRLALGNALDHLPATSLTPMIGYLGCASGTAATCLAVLCLQHGWIPPTLNFRTPDPACRLQPVTRGFAAELEHILVVNRGWSGQNTVLAIRRFSAAQA